MILDLFSLKGKTAIVTGSEGLLGSMICQTIRELNGSVIPVDLKTGIDITIFSEVLTLAGEPCDILINAAVGNQKPVENFDANWRQDIEI